jgi:hypothetical protein
MFRNGAISSRSKEMVISRHGGKAEDTHACYGECAGAGGQARSCIRIEIMKTETDVSSLQPMHI